MKKKHTRLKGWQRRSYLKKNEPWGRMFRQWRWSIRYPASPKPLTAAMIQRAIEEARKSYF